MLSRQFSGFHRTAFDCTHCKTPDDAGNSVDRIRSRNTHTRRDMNDSYCLHDVAHMHPESGFTSSLHTLQGATRRSTFYAASIYPGGGCSIFGVCGSINLSIPLLRWGGLVRTAGLLEVLVLLPRTLAVDRNNLILGSLSLVRPLKYLIVLSSILAMPHW